MFFKPSPSPLISKMAARSDAAATPGPKNGVFMSVSLVSSSSNCLTLLKKSKDKHPETHL